MSILTTILLIKQWANHCQYHLIIWLHLSWLFTIVDVSISAPTTDSYILLIFVFLNIRKRQCNDINTIWHIYNIWVVLSTDSPLRVLDSIRLIWINVKHILKIDKLLDRAKFAVQSAKFNWPIHPTWQGKVCYLKCKILINQFIESWFSGSCFHYNFGFKLRDMLLQQNMDKNKNLPWWR